MLTALEKHRDPCPRLTCSLCAGEESCTTARGPIRGMLSWKNARVVAGLVGTVCVAATVSLVVAVAFTATRGTELVQGASGDGTDIDYR